MLEDCSVLGANKSVPIPSVNDFADEGVRAINLSYSRFESLDWFDLKFDHLESFNASHNQIFSILSSLFDRTAN